MRALIVYFGKGMLFFGQFCLAMCGLMLFLGWMLGGGVFLALWGTEELGMSHWWATPVMFLWIASYGAMGD